MYRLEQSAKAFEEAKHHIPGGVNSPVRSFRSVGGVPPFISKAYGSRIFDIDGNEYIDYVGSWGPMVLGHAHPAVVEAVTAAAAKGTSYGAPTTLETELAALIKAAMPSLELVRMVNSGTEAAMSVLRLARAFTGRPRIVKFSGCYHGHSDSLLVRTGSGATTLGVPDSPGVLETVAEQTLSIPFNDEDALYRVFAKHANQIAAVIIEPVAGNMGLVLPKAGFLRTVRDITEHFGALLIFDEVMTGFRVAGGGAQALFGIKPDLTCLGKIIGGGLPVGAYGGRRDVMEHVAPLGPVYQAGTMSGNPLAMAAGAATLRILLNTAGLYEKLTDRTSRLVTALRQRAAQAGVPVQAASVGAMFGLFFSEQPVTDYQSALKADTEAFSTYFHAMLKRGIYLAPSQFEAGFVSAAHTEEDVEKTIIAGGEAFAEVAESFRQRA